VAARFDPDQLHDGLHVYRLDGGYLGHAPVIEAVGFDNADAAREHGRQRRRWLNAQRDMLDAERRMSPAQVAALVPMASGPAPQSATVLQLPRPVLDLKRSPSRAVTQDQEARRDALVTEFRQAAAPQRDDRAERFARALNLEAALRDGGDIGDGEVAWLERYRGTPEYRAQRQMHDEFGAETA
jgi:hypothetical protein